MLVFDSNSGNPVAEIDIAGDADDIFFDRESRRLYVSCGAGSLEVVQQDNPDKYHTTAKVPTARGARTSFFAPELRKLFLAAPARSGHSAGILVYKVNL